MVSNPHETSKTQETSSKCAWTSHECWRKPWVKSTATLAVLALLGVGGWFLWFRSCEDCALHVLERQVVGLQEQIDKLSATMQAQSVEGLDQTQQLMGERLDKLEVRIDQAQETLLQSQGAALTQKKTEWVEEMRPELQRMVDVRSAAKTKESLKWVRLALLMASGKAFDALLDRLEPDLKKADFPSAWIQDMRAWSKNPAPSRDMLCHQGRWLLKKHHGWHHAKSGQGCALPSENKAWYHQVGCWVSHQWNRLFSVAPQAEVCASEVLTLEDLIQQVKNLKETHSAKEQGAITTWLTQAEQRVQLDQAADALWNTLIEDSYVGVGDAKA